MTDTWIETFQKDGICAIPDFVSPEDCDRLMAEIKLVVQELKQRKVKDHNYHTIVFDQSGKGDPFIDKLWDSAEDIDYFFEPNVFDDKGESVIDPGTGEKLTFENSISKIGHALHMKNKVFYDFIWDDKFIDIFKKINWENPKVPQSMYIFKPPRFGSAVPPHRDSTFLHNYRTDRKELNAGDNQVGLWLALEDATLENGCLYAVPGSHKTFPGKKEGIDSMTPRRCRRDSTKRCMSDTGTDEVYPDEEWKAMPVKKGTLVLIHGAVMHRSFENKSDKTRHVVTWHCIEGGKSCKWASDNWQQLKDPKGDFKAYF